METEVVIIAEFDLDSYWKRIYWCQDVFIYGSYDVKLRREQRKEIWTFSEPHDALLFRLKWL